MENLFLEVALPVPLHRAFDYQANASSDIAAGMRVSVPFGNRAMTGVVLDVKTESRYDSKKIKQVTAVLDEEPVLDKELLRLGRWISQYYHAPIGEVFSLLLPAWLRAGKPTQIKGEPSWYCEYVSLTEALEELKRAPKQQQLLEYIHAHQPVTARDLSIQFDNWHAPLKRLKELGHVKEREQFLQDSAVVTESAHSLNPEQQSAVDQILQSLDAANVFLLDGVTGSGKTEVYFHAIDAVLSQGKQVLVLVPEIGLTPQLIRRFQKRFAHKLAAMHSGLSDRERAYAWNLVRTGVADIVIGTRSAVLASMLRPGLMIVDEEHDLSYKQQDGVRYHARDIAVLRGKWNKLPVVLGSATPSAESLANALSGKYVHLKLRQRAGNAQMPGFTMLDMRHKKLHANLSPTLIETTRKHLADGHQVLFFLNRRGFSPALLCHDCGWVAHCHRCDASLTYHRSLGRMLCHHCGSVETTPVECGHCKSESLIQLGAGTQRIEDALTELFPETRILRIDRDSTARKQAFENLMQEARTGQPCILVGTQMLAKGHHLPNVTLVGLLDVDQGLYSADFRGIERLAQTVIQVAGRAGRAERAGEVMIQTHHPDHPLLQLLTQKGYEAFSTMMLSEREAAQFPPYGFFALLRAEATGEKTAVNFLGHVYRKLSELQSGKVFMYEPMPAPMERRAGRYRAQLLLQSHDRKALHGMLDTLVQVIETLKAARTVRWSIDVDPMEMY